MSARFTHWLGAFLTIGTLLVLGHVQNANGQCTCYGRVTCDDCTQCTDYLGTDGLDDDSATDGQIPQFQIDEQFASVGSETFIGVPSVLGDTQSGGCGGLFFNGGLAAVIDHPSYACTRLNIAESNSPIVRDRFAVNYRHLHAASLVSIFPDSFQRAPQDNDIDRATFIFERRLTTESSLEVRVPVNHQLSAENVIFHRPGNNNLDAVYNNLKGEFGNLAAIFKRSLIVRPGVYVSGGVGVNLPTAPDIRVAGDISDPNLPIRLNNNTIQPVPVNLLFDGTIENETVNVMPFLAFVRRDRSSNWFQQGFMQLDLPANRSSSRIDIPVLNAAGFNGNTGTFNFDIQQQTLLRLNGQIGYMLYENRACRVSAVSAVFEVHYSSTLNDATVNSVTVFNNAGTTVNLDVGNTNNRVDVLNLVAALPIQIGDFTFYNGVTVPVRRDADRGFDFEYTLILEGSFN